ncbi:MAG: hypothetical protein N2V75_04075 [Methanophagales archaeon]|nr:hypothetical protein [Methanophagales archaeon]
MKKKILSLFLIFIVLSSTAVVAGENAWAKTSQVTASYCGQEQSQSFALKTTNLISHLSEAYDTSGIEHLASSLDYDPVKIYYYVRNNVDYEPYFGVMAGPEWTLMEGAGNSFDQALLLSSLLHEAGIQTRYVYGEIEVSADDAAKWLRSGNATQAATLLASSGIPNITRVDYGTMVTVRKEHMWVEAKLASESDWTPLDPSFKLYEYVEGMESPIDLTWSSNFLNEVLNTAEYDTNQGWITNVNGTFAVEKMDEYANEIFGHILSDSELRNRTLTQVFGYWQLQKENPPLSSSLPYEVISSKVSSEIPEEYSYKARFKLGTINYSAPTAEIAGKRITIHFIPATEEDKEHIDRAGGIFNVTPHMVKMKPILFIEGESVAEGAPLTLGERITLTTEFYNERCPYFSKADKTLTVGGFYAVVSNFGKVSSSLVEKHMSSLNTTIYKLSTTENVTKEEVVGELLYLTGLTYFYEADFLSDVISLPDIRWYRPIPSQVITSLDIGGWIYENDIKSRLYAGGMSIDIPHEGLIVVGDNINEEIAFRLSTDMIGSCLEHEIFEQLYGIESVSTMKIFEEANNRGIRIYTITGENVGEVLPVLQLPDNVKKGIKEDVDAGRIVVVPEKEIQIKSWNGTGWASIDPKTGVGEYGIYGGLRGELEGGTTVELVKWVHIFLEKIYISLKEEIEKYEIIEDIIKKIKESIEGSEIIELLSTFTYGNIFDSLEKNLFTEEQGRVLIGITKGISDISHVIAFLGFKYAAFGLISIKCGANSYFPYLSKLYKKIQRKIGAARPGDTIIIEDGIYTENIKVDKRLMIISKNGPEKTTIQAANPDDHVFEVTADSVKISGFTVKGAKRSAGIHLCHADHGHISNSTISDNGCGIYLNSSCNNIIYFNNFISNTDNVHSYGSTNIWNSTEKITYIYNGTTYKNYLGNYWDDYNGTDADGDGIGDTPYSIDSDMDNYPLMKRFENYFANR